MDNLLTFHGISKSLWPRHTNHFGSLSENTHSLCKWKYHYTADLLFDWFRNDQTSKSVLYLNVGKTTESKPVKQEVTSPYKVSLYSPEREYLQLSISGKITVWCYISSVPIKMYQPNEYLSTLVALKSIGRLFTFLSRIEKQRY